MFHGAQPPAPHSPIHHIPLSSPFFLPTSGVQSQTHNSCRGKSSAPSKQWCQSRGFVSSPSLPSSLQMRSCCINYPRLNCGGKKKQTDIRPDIARQWQFRSRISTAVISKLQWQSKLLVITKHTCIILILQCSCCVTQCFLIWTIKQVSSY